AESLPIPRYLPPARGSSGPRPYMVAAKPRDCDRARPIRRAPADPGRVGALVGAVRERGANGKSDDRSGSEKFAPLPIVHPVASCLTLTGTAPAHDTPCE